MENKGQRIYKIIMLLVIVIIITSLATAFATYHYLSNAGISTTSKNETTKLSGLEYTLSKFRSEFEKKYIGEINDEDLIDGAIKGYVAGLGDPYTTYYTKEEMAEIMEETNGNFVGIGIYMTLDTEKNLITIINPIEGSPAEKAGILPGDYIVKVDGKEYTGEQLEEASNKIKGEEGTEVKIEILRGTEIKEFTIKRAKVLISHISTEVLEDNIGYISISDFEGGCAEEFKKKYEELKKQGITKLVVDIRNNGGGIVSEATDIADMFTDKGDVLLITTDKNNNEEITTSKNNPSIKIPVVMLVNEYSASASEILAGALKENEKATLVGKTTYGKGVIQELHQLSDGSGLKITTNEYFTPKHNKINKVGIEPNIEVKITGDEDAQLQKAVEILKNK